MSLFEGSQSELYWFLLGLVLLVAELVLPGFVIVFFGIGAWITALCIFLGITTTINAQLLVFIGSSLVTLVLFRKRGERYFTGRVSRKLDDVAALDDVKGERAVVIEDILPANMSGRVEFHGTSWKATADREIKTGTPVEIVARENLTLRVKPVI